MTDREWQLSVAASAERQLQRLPEKVAVAVGEFVLGPCARTPIAWAIPASGNWPVCGPLGEGPIA